MNEASNRSRKLLTGLTIVLLVVGLVQFVVLGGSEATEIPDLPDPSELPPPGSEPSDDREPAATNDDWTFPTRPLRVSPFQAEESDAGDTVATELTLPEPPTTTTTTTPTAPPTTTTTAPPTTTTAPPTTAPPTTAPPTTAPATTAPPTTAPPATQPPPTATVVSEPVEPAQSRFRP